MTPTSCRVDISLSSNKYSIILTYCFTVTEYKYVPYKWNTILPDSRKTVVYDKGICRTDTAVCLLASRPKHVEFHSEKKNDTLVHLVGFATEMKHIFSSPKFIIFI